MSIRLPAFAPGARATAALVLFVAVVVAGWNAAPAGRIDAGVFGASIFGVAACVAAGAWLPALLGERASRCDGFAARLVAGFIALDLLAFVLYVALPMGIVACMLAACVAAAIAGLALGRARRVAPMPAVPRADALVIVVAALAATFWCRDYLSPLQPRGDEVVVQGWQDIFLHVRIVSAIAQSEGLRSLQNVTLAGVPAQLYHYASYLPAAALVRAGTADALQAFTTCLVPVGMLLATLAAYALGSALLGRAAGAAGALAVLLLPDALQQGFGNEILGYHGMQAIAPGGLYAVAACAIGWLLILEACMQRRPMLVLAGWAAIVCVLPFKAQLFVANAYAAFVFPLLFMGGMRPAMRAAAVAGATLVFALAVMAANSTHVAPLMRLDGTGAAPYAHLLAMAQEPGRFFHGALERVAAMSSPAPRVAALALLAIVLAFGLWSVPLALALRRAVRAMPAAVVAFPIAVLATYAIMSAGLALDTNRAGSPEELLNRPFVWAYFACCSWAAAMLWPQSAGRSATRLAVAAVVLALAVPWHFGRDLQSLPLWMPHADGIHLPRCLVEIAHHIRDTGSASSVMQVSDGDPRAQWSALAERQAYAIDLANGMVRTPEKEARLRELHALGAAADARAVDGFMRARGISWFVATPAARVAWAPALEARLAMRCGGYTLYRFD